MRAPVLALFFVLVGVGCVAELRSGVYGCPDGVCPEGQTCGTDALCRDVSDTRSGRYGACASDADCYDGACIVARGATAGVCSETCMPVTGVCPSSGLCAPLNSVNDGRCQASCDSTSCAAGLTCIPTPTTPGLRSCFAARTEWGAARSCRSNADCTAPEECAFPSTGSTVGVCAWPCGGMGDACPANDACVGFVSPTVPNPAIEFSMPFATNLCLKRCATNADCGPNTDLGCVQTTDPNAKACVPTAWMLP